MKRGKKLIGLVVTVILGLSLILIPVASRVSPVQAAVTWTKSGEVTLENESYVVDAWVIKESSTSYKMWYTHVKKDLSISEIIDTLTTTLDLDALINDIANLDLEQFLGHLTNLDASDIADFLDGISTVIGYATSTNGKTWTKVNSEVLVGSSSAAWNSVGAPCVIWDETDGKYKMWYTRAKTDLTQGDLGGILTDLGDSDPDIVKTAILDLMDSFSTVIGYATSNNGITWAVQDSQVLPVSSIDVWSSVADPSVVKTSGSYEMWYTRPKTDINQAALSTILTNIDTFGIADLLDILDGTSTVIGYATSNNGVTWTVQDSQVLPVSSIDVWSSVADPSVVKTGGGYEMWYTNVKTNLLEADLHTLASEIKELDIAALWTTLNDEGIFQFITDLVAGIDDIKALLDSTSTVIGYATSSDGANWVVQNSQHLIGSSGSLWSGVAAPSVVKTSDRYEMWYTEGIGELTWQNLLDLVLGDNLPIGYASYTPALPPSPPPPLPPPGVTDVSDVVTDEGVFTEEVITESEDGVCELLLEEGTIGLTEEGEPLSEISMVELEEAPTPPGDSNVIGLVYDFGPDGATFDPPITLTFTYDELLITEGVTEENLVIAMWDEETGEWVTLEDITVDPETNTITAKVSHFTAFTVLAYTRPAAFVASDLSITPTEVNIGGSVTISVLIANAGDLTGSYEVALKIDNVVVTTKEVTLAGGASQKVTFTTSKDAVGTYSVNVSGITGSFTVKEEVVPPVVPPVPATFAISNLFISPTEVDIGEEVTISVLIANTGELTGSYEVKLKIDNVVVATKEVALAGSTTQTVTFTTAKEEAGTYTIDANGLAGSFTVKEEVVPPVVPPEEVTEATAWWVWLIVGLGVVVIGGLLAYFLWWKRRIA